MRRLPVSAQETARPIYADEPCWIPTGMHPTNELLAHMGVADKERHKVHYCWK